MTTFIIGSFHRNCFKLFFPFYPAFYWYISTGSSFYLIWFVQRNFLITYKSFYFFNFTGYIINRKGLKNFPRIICITNITFYFSYIKRNISSFWIHPIMLLMLCVWYLYTSRKIPIRTFICSCKNKVTCIQQI